MPAPGSHRVRHLVAALALAACSRTPPGDGHGGPAGAPAPPRPARVQPRAAEEFIHPLLAAASDRPVHEDCSRQALTTVTQQIRIAAAQATPVRGRAAARVRPVPGACRSPEIEELGRSVRQQMLGRVGACVAKDGPLDAEWDMAYSSVLSLGVCLDCARPTEEQAVRCQRAIEIARRIDHPPR